LPSHLCTTYMSATARAVNAANESKAPAAKRVMARIACQFGSTRDSSRDSAARFHPQNSNGTTLGSKKATSRGRKRIGTPAGGRRLQIRRPRFGLAAWAGRRIVDAMSKPRVTFKMQRIAEDDWQILAEYPGVEPRYIKGLKSKAEVDEWLQGTRRIDWLRSQGYAK
jgi:hypothetical protein